MDSVYHQKNSVIKKMDVHMTDNSNVKMDYVFLNKNIVINFKNKIQH